MAIAVTAAVAMGASLAGDLGTLANTVGVLLYLATALPRRRAEAREGERVSRAGR